MHISNVINLLNSEPELNLCVLESIEGLDRLDFSVRVRALLWWQSTEGLSSLLSYHNTYVTCSVQFRPKLHLTNPPTCIILEIELFITLNSFEDVIKITRIPFLFELVAVVS